MPGRGNARGRGGRGTNFKPSARSEVSVHDRLGAKNVSYNRPGTNSTKKIYKYTRPPSTVTTSVATAPQEAKIKTLTKKFLKSYYDIFDLPGRANLESHYSVDAFFSFSATYESPTGYGRNLLKVAEPSLRVSLLAHNKTAIAHNLRLFPPTEHMVNFLSYDVPYYIVNPMSVTNMQIVVTGVFRDTSQTTNPLRAFTRVFILKQVSTDQQGEPVYEIFNDLFMLQPPTPDQIKRYHNDCQIVKRLSTGTSQERSNHNILQSIMNRTKMNRDGSRKLLEESNWDEEKAMSIFNTLNAENKIPQSYFL